MKKIIENEVTFDLIEGSVITSAQTTNYILFKLSELTPGMKAVLFDENGEPKEPVIDKQWYRERILAAAGCL